jgi:hypothetical protein
MQTYWRVAAWILLIVVGLFLAVIAPVVNFAVPQQSTAKSTPKSKQVRRTKADTQNVYSDSWEAGEVKSCMTFSGHVGVIVCDGDKVAWPGSFVNLLGNSVSVGTSEDQAYERALSEAIVSSKRFIVEFSDSYGRDPTPWPKPQTGLKKTLWDCSKEKIISCSLGAREK